MTKTLNRRDWLKSGLLLAGGLVASPSFAYKRSMPVKSASTSLVKELMPELRMTESRMLARLNANENPYGPSPKVIQAITESVSLGNRYGHGDAATLISMIAEKEGVDKECIMLGPGSTDLLEKAAITRFQHGGNIVSADPSYMSVMSTAQAMGGKWKPVPLAADYSHDFAGMAAAIDKDTRLVYVCNPNNPTGSISDAAALRKFCLEVSPKVPVFVDEAYLEFLETPETQTMVGLVAEGKDVIVARTFSKIHGMAGLRIGYIVATPERIQSITEKVRSTMGLCVTSLKGAIASMQETAFLAECKSQNTECREFITSEIIKLGYSPIPSFTSFVIFPIHMEGEKFMKGMYGEGVGIRAYDMYDKPWCRVSMGTQQELELFLETFKKVTQA
ncbi:histidinol-phosphate aminotransferase family protein [Algoriphagus sp. H41]|uniref:Histidinol-phosphate aminotransferase family protein n=1 Tax=Algoriphagus oliviformis TaxID=2811231 RepID=A0ABS3C0V9_9BACT|nr:histidinol-phosphate transaminase [Algoriphagus oliviformis]MBN7810755.1 histidinol-phosphate aminotransferase family protein [Algoriphagus oliviformis]